MRLILTLFVGIMLVNFTSPAFAESDATVTVFIPGIYEIEYTGGPIIKFDIGYDNLIEGSMGIVNDGDIIWWANGYPWKIMIERSLWTTDDGDPDLQFILEVKSGPPDNGSWTLVPWENHEDAPADWIFSENLGLTTGGGEIIEGIDWKIKELYWWMEPGTYTCTVKMTIGPV